jgi:acyl-homoserine-lactone acylase
MKKLALLLLCGCFSSLLSAQSISINPKGIDIVRDSFGVPHIFAKTDPEVAYGLGWATCEDDFSTLQWGLMAAKNMMGRFMSVEGAKIDFAVQLMGVHKYVDEHYDSEVPADMKRMYEAYVAGVNAYAAKHPEEVLVKGEFPATTHDLVSGYILAMSLIGGVQGSIEKMVSGDALTYYDTMQEQHFKGSNAWAMNSSKTKDGRTYLNINSHQPLDGPMSWYEVHLCSEEGWNALGGTFHGGLCVFHGVNENLGWAHTVNEDIDLIDLFKLQMHPHKKNYYLFDNEWKKLEVHKAKLIVALGKKKKFKLPVWKKYWTSVYGPTMKSKKGVVAMKMAVLSNLHCVEQWYRMNKAKNFYEFRKALDIQGITMQNFTYADKYDTIYKVSNGLIPMRAPGYNWRGTVTGNTSRTLWTKVYPVDSLPQYLNPACGYVFNCNNSSIEATAKNENHPLSKFNPDMGFDLRKTTRGERFYELMTREYPGKIDYADFKRIKYDHHMPDSMQFLRHFDVNEFFHLKADKYPDIADAITRINHWNHEADSNNRDLPILLRSLYYVYYQSADKEALLRNDPKAREDLYIHCIRMGKDTLNKYFGTIDISLNQFQKHQRGDVELGVQGGPDLLNAAYAGEYKDGKMKIWIGDSYIELVRFTPTGPEIESISPYGASNKPGAKHYTDQMQMYVNHQLKHMTLNKQEVYAHAEQIYHPE